MSTSYRVRSSVHKCLLGALLTALLLVSFAAVAQAEIARVSALVRNESGQRLINSGVVTSPGTSWEKYPPQTIEPGKTAEFAASGPDRALMWVSYEDNAGREVGFRLWANFTWQGGGFGGGQGRSGYSAYGPPNGFHTEVLGSAKTAMSESISVVIKSN